MPPADGPPRGFTLIEMLVVLVVLGLLAGLLVLRGPQRSASLELQRATNLISSAVRTARGLAIATSQPVPLRIAPGGAALQVANLPATALPPGILAAASGPMLFRPDGSSSGGRVDYAGYGRHAVLEVSWLNGRISFPPVP